MLGSTYYILGGGGWSNDVWSTTDLSMFALLLCLVVIEAQADVQFIGRNFQMLHGRDALSLELQSSTTARKYGNPNQLS